MSVSPDGDRKMHLDASFALSELLQWGITLVSISSWFDANSFDTDTTDCCKQYVISSREKQTVEHCNLLRICK